MRRRLRSLPGSSRGSFEPAIDLAGYRTVGIVEAVEHVLDRAALGRDGEILHGDELGHREAIMHPARAAIVVAHNHVNRLWLTALMGWPMIDYRRKVSQDPAGYSIIGWGVGPPLVQRINAVPPLG